MKEKLAALYSLQQQDSALDALKKQYATLDAGKSEQAAQVVAKAAHDQADRAFHTLSGELHDTELEQKTVEEKRQAEETRLYSGKITNPKELQAITDEVAGLGRQHERLDEKLAPLRETLEAARKEEADTKKALAVAVKALKLAREQHKQQSETIVLQARAIQAQRTQIAATIPSDLLKRYDVLRANPLKNGIAIAPLEDNNACGACRMGLPSSIVKMVHLGNELILCDNCKRILCEKQS